MKTQRLWSVLVVLTIAAAMPVLAGPAEVQLRQTHLELVAELSYDDGSLDGKLRLVVENASERPATELPLNLNRLMRFTGARSGEDEPLDFEQDVVIFADDGKRQVTHAVVALPRPLAPGESTTVVLPPPQPGHRAGPFPWLWRRTRSPSVSESHVGQETEGGHNDEAWPGRGRPAGEDEVPAEQDAQ